MPLDHLLRHVLLVPAGIGLVVALALWMGGKAAWPRWIGLLFAAAFAAALLVGPNFSSHLPPRSADDLLPLAAALFAVFSLIHLGAGATGSRRLLLDGAVLLPPSAWIAWLTASQVQAYYRWNAFALAGVVILATLGGVVSALLHREVARKHPAPGVIAGWLITATGASLALILGRTARGAEFAGTLCAVLGPAFVMALLRGREARAEAFAVPVAGALYAVLLFGVLQGELIWISAALLILLSSAAGLLQLRSRSTWTLIGALGFVSLLPAAAAVFMSLMKSEAGSPAS